MVFPSLPVYLDPPNWNQQTHPPADDDVIRHHLPPPPASDNGDGPVRPGSMAERARLAKIPQPEASLRCPRCDSSNTKFCYFNNYSLSQPRHFCKTCRRYWTRGGALRSVPVGGGCRRNKRSSKLCTTPTSSSYKPQIGAAVPSSSTGTSAVPASSGSMNLLFPMTSMASLYFSAPWQQQQDFVLEQWRIEQMQQTALIPPATYWGGIETSTPPRMYNLNTEVEGGGLGLGFGGSSSQGRQFWNVGSSGGGGGGNGNCGGWMSTADI